MFSQIVNPKTNRKVNINSKKGKEILTNYIGIQSGGKVEWDNYYQRFIATGGRATTERSLAEIRFLELLGVKYNGPDGVVENYARFWIKPNVRYHQFGYRNNHGRFIPMSLNDFLETLWMYPGVRRVCRGRSNARCISTEFLRLGSDASHGGMV